MIKRGQILHSENFVDIGHGKFFVIIGITDDSIVGFFFINSNVNKYLFNKPELLAMQYPMRKEDYGFLRYDSFLCATKILKLNKQDIVSGLQNGTVQIISQLIQEHLDDVLTMVRNSDLFKEREKRQFFY
ncbi:MAG: hypothetical protein PUC50_04365 [Bacteroidales bacterium]|nr:hypothetical protein [Bacteroidales bacterium]